jgi:hypothetical protein
MYVKVVFGKLGLVCWHNPPFVKRDTDILNSNFKLEL